MSHPQVLITDYAWPSLDVERSILEPLGATLLVAERGDQEELLRLAPQADAILTCWRQIPVAVTSPLHAHQRPVAEEILLKPEAVDAARPFRCVVDEVMVGDQVQISLKQQNTRSPILSKTSFS
jgi:hypothetical protein